MSLQEIPMPPETIARVEVQRNFCGHCAGYIKKELEDVKGIKNLRFYPSDLLITFNFRKAQHLSEVLNRLFLLGYPEKGEISKVLGTTNLVCRC
ncbi:hypothetical protein [Winogradskyella sp. A2]|uniref:hypothetical protein n=1 Tax=Winogradskyella sp. A2 TaxID=3366944 RepID=UPI00398C6A74